MEKNHNMNISVRILFFTIIITLVTACLKEPSHEELLEEEMQLLKEYLDENNVTASPTPSGLYYIEQDSGTGLQPELIEDFILIEFTGRYLDGNIIIETTNEELAHEENIYSNLFLYGPFKIQMKEIGIAGLIEGLMMMHEGGKARLIIPSYLAYRDYFTLIYDLELIEVIKDPVKHQENELNNYLTTSYERNSDSITEPCGIERSASGVYYIESESGKGVKAQPNDIVDISFVEKLLDGRVIDSVSNTTYISVTLIENQIIKGLYEGIQMMNEGDKGILIIPYDLAYGEERYDKIPPYSALVFEIHLKNIQ